MPPVLPPVSGRHLGPALLDRARMVREDRAERAALPGGFQSDPRDLPVDPEPRDPQALEEGMFHQLERVLVRPQSGEDGLRDGLQDVERHAADLHGSLEPDRRGQVSGCDVDAADCGEPVVMAQPVFEFVAPCTAFQYVPHVLLVRPRQDVLAYPRGRPVGECTEQGVGYRGHDRAPLSCEIGMD